MSSFMDVAGRVDTIWFPFTDTTWLKIWQVADTKPGSSIITTHPYNYQIAYGQTNPQTPGHVFGPETLDRLVKGLTDNKIANNFC